MNTNTLTETDALALAIASALDGGNWGKPEAGKAVARATKLFQDGRLDAPSFANVVARLGNHSQTRQHLEKHGLLRVSDDALASAIRKAASASEAALASLGEPSAPAKK